MKRPIISRKHEPMPLIWWWFGRDPYWLDGRRTLLVTIYAWPDEEQETGELVRSLAHIAISWIPGFGFKSTRYSPNRAEHWLARASERPETTPIKAERNAA